MKLVTCVILFFALVALSGKRRRKDVEEVDLEAYLTPFVEEMLTKCDSLELVARRRLQEEDEVPAEEEKVSNREKKTDGKREMKTDGKREKNTDGERKSKDEESVEDGVSREDKMAAKKEERLTALFMEVYTEEYCTTAGKDVAALVSGLVGAMETKKEEVLAAKVNAMAELALSKCARRLLKERKEREAREAEKQQRFEKMYSEALCSGEITAEQIIAEMMENKSAEDKVEEVDTALLAVKNARSVEPKEEIAEVEKEEKQAEREAREAEKDAKKQERMEKKSAGEDKVVEGVTVDVPALLAEVAEEKVSVDKVVSGEEGKTVKSRLERLKERYSSKKSKGRGRKSN